MAKVIGLVFVSIECRAYCIIKKVVKDPFLQSTRIFLSFFFPVSILETSLLPLFSIPFTLNVNTSFICFEKASEKEKKKTKKNQDSDPSNFSLYQSEKLNCIIVTNVTVTPKVAKRQKFTEIYIRFDLPENLYFTCSVLFWLSLVGRCKLICLITGTTWSLVAIRTSSLPATWKLI